MNSFDQNFLNAQEDLLFYRKAINDLMSKFFYLKEVGEFLEADNVLFDIKNYQYNIQTIKKQFNILDISLEDIWEPEIC